MTKDNHTSWPSIGSAYVDEFGPIEREVYQAAGELWPQAERYSISVLQDGPAGQRILHNAAAIVSRIYLERSGRINNLKAYLYQTFKRLVLAQLEKESGHRKLEAAMLSRTTEEAESLTTDIDRKILVQQIMQRMDRQMREIFELLVLGHTFEEIGQHLNRSAHSIRTAYNRRLNRLIMQIKAETLAAENKPLDSKSIIPGSES